MKLTIQFTAPEPVTPPAISNPMLFGSGDFQLTYSLPASRTLVLEASTNLVHWLSLQTNQSSGTMGTFTNPGATANRERYYRLRSE